MKLAAVLLILLCLPAASAHAGSETGAVVHAERPRFVVDTPCFLGAGGEAELRVQVVVPYTELLFEKQADGFAAHVELVIIVYEGKEQVGGDLWTREVTAATAPETVDPKSAFSQEHRFTVRHGKVRVKVEVKDAASGRQGEIERKLEIPAFEGLSMSDLRFASCAAGRAPGEFEPAYVRARFGGNPLPPICVTGEIYDRERVGGARRGGYRIVWRIRDENGRDKTADTLDLPADSLRTPFAVNPRLDALSLGRYEFIAELRSGGRTLRRVIPFEMDESRISLTAGFDDLLAMAGYIGTSSEISKLEGAAPEEREALWDEFWRRRDPSPGTPENEAKEEFFRRVQHANETFASVDMPGWRTDRGMIYIRNGPPDQIESRPMNAMDPPYEVWHYFALNRSYVFADYNGFGQYTLVRTMRAGGGGG